MQCPDEHAAVCAVLRVPFHFEVSYSENNLPKSPLVAAPMRLRETGCNKIWHGCCTILARIKPRDSLLICEDWATTWMPWTTVLSNPVRGFFGEGLEDTVFDHLCS